MTIRTFIALPILSDTANQLGDVAAKMSYQDKSGALRWVDQENYHVTLAFLGEQDEADLETLAEQLDYHIGQIEFEIVLSHVSPFPETRPKLIAAMLERSEELNSLYKEVMRAVKSTSVLVDKRKFIPHVTLGRYRHSRNNYVGNIPLNASFESVVNEVVLYQSTLTASGAEYEPIYRFPLDQFDELPEGYIKGEFSLSEPEGF
jgi:2'-5' RNA ligase